PPAPPSASPAPALALAMCLCRPFGAATAVAGLEGLVLPAGVMLARCGSKVGRLSWRELVALVLERLAAFAAAAAATPSAPSAALPRLARGLRLLTRGLRVLLLFALGGVFRFRRLLLVLLPFVLLLVVVAFVLVLLDRRDGGCRLQRQRLRLLQAVHLLALFDHEGQLPAEGGIGVDHDGDAEALLQHAQMRALVIEEIERNVGA